MRPNVQLANFATLRDLTPLVRHAAMISVSDLGENLAMLCSYHRSIAEVCRRIGINRQQFNKYLSGHSHPSQNNMRRICDFFGVSPSELLMPPARLEQIVGLRGSPVMRPERDELLRHFDRIHAVCQPLDRYIGFYFRYFYSFGNKGLIIRSLASIQRRDDRFYWKNVEILRDPDTRRQSGINKYEGIVLYLADRIHFLEYETMQVNSITQMTLYPSYQQRLDYLVGIQTGGPTRRGRKPGASRVALEFLGRSLNARRALSETGFIRPDDPSLRPEIRDAISNEIEDGAYVLEIDEP
jgi:transcriptional regulator with XRE-family HTH domain